MWRRRHCRFMCNRLARPKATFGPRVIGPIVTATITGCRAYGWLRRGWACYGHPHTGASPGAYMGFMPAIGDRTLVSTAALIMDSAMAESDSWAASGVGDISPITPQWST